MKTQKNLSIGGIGLAAGALACVGLMSAGVPVSQAATYYTPDFSGPLTLSNTAGPGVWYTDRYAPAGFSTSGGILSETVDPSGPVGTSQDIQGRDYNINLSGNVQTASIELYLQPSWSTTATGSSTDVAAGFWGAGSYMDNNSPTISAYPIISFINDPGYYNSASPGFYTWNYETGTYSATTAPVNYGGWNTLSYTLTVGQGTEYYVNGVDVGGVTDATTTSLSAVLLEVKNYGTQYTAQWAAVTPVPASFGLVGVGSLALIGGLALRRRMAKFH